SRVKAMKVSENILTAHPGVDAIWAASDKMALGALQTLKAYNKQEEILLGGFDGTPEDMAQINTGNMAFTIDQVPYKMGAVAITLSYLAAKDKQFKKSVVLDTRIIDKSNVESASNTSESKRRKIIDGVMKRFGLSQQ